MKIKELQQILAKKKIDVALFYNFNFQETNSNLIYFAGYTGVGFLIIPQKKKPFLAVPGMEYIRAKKQSKVRVVKFEKNLAKLIKSAGRIKKAGIDEVKMSVKFYKRLKKELKADYVDLSKEVAKLRMIKTEEELRLIKKACSITDAILQQTLKNFKQFKTEVEICSYLDSEAKKQGCELAFSPMVASGVHSTQAHFEPTKDKLRKGFCIIDFGINYKGYSSDMSRTIYIGNPSKQELEDYELVLQAQLDSIQALIPQFKASYFDKLARKALGKKVKYFNHALGHGVGIDIHEAPNLGPKGKEILKENMVFTIEPGIYMKNKYGIRIEDVVLLKKKPVLLTKTPKHLLIIENGANHF